ASKRWRSSTVETLLALKQRNHNHHHHHHKSNKLQTTPSQSSMLNGNGVGDGCNLSPVGGGQTSPFSASSFDRLSSHLGSNAGLLMQQKSLNGGGSGLQHAANGTGEPYQASSHLQSPQHAHQQ